ncbi:MAG: hypothetical protein A2383_02945 [Candidatus Pacebacteria bacterium RIFOXYB1_FULL_39_46]|nr:MAG: hypothetical protein A2182_01005 [Candidatus Pacebacteria bacterium RIFOXYA1_FULL_38_18]OGJ38797.1 MAG: hypothetical protein A2383_02945 [Candidatus Pacebacteria bacterium RIFOXYB1_FULL_39_46]OGJ39943.1 MAG: hypothetical protein A2582_00935 [Candidatus Pacebacteria bacterium RIFOXYD1_FULL_39_27]OGJ41223.1 MAG: hypothetical protein A2411_00045 [Candidatus Pacebacteria bacterium RIFOXYC1_FULL_39_21]
MKKIYPYIFPAVALLFVFFLLFRWYNLRTQREAMTSLLNEGVVIEQLTAEDAKGLIAGVGDYESVDLVGEDPTHLGEVRYELRDDELLFSVFATLPAPATGDYQVWLRQTEGNAQRKAFRLTASKSGYMGSGALDASTLPLEIIVSNELTDDGLLEKVLLRGTIEVSEK